MDFQTSIETRHLVARLRFRHLQLLLELRKAGSLRAAATVLNLTQPALSKTLREVEGAFGFALFIRSASGVVPTPRGEIVLGGAALLLEELAHLGRETSEESAITLLRIGVPPFVAQGYLPAVFVRLLDGQTRVRVQLHEERVPLLMQLLTDGKLDALITSYPAEKIQPDAVALHYEKLFEAEFSIIAPAAHRLARARQVSWQELAKERWIMPPPVSMLRRMADEAFRSEGVANILPVIESSSPVTNVQLVAAGLGLSAVPTAILAGALAAGQVKQLRVRPPIASGPVALVYRAAPHNPRLALLKLALGLA